MTYQYFSFENVHGEARLKMGWMVKKYNISFLTAGRGSSIGSVSAWQASGLKFDPHVRHILSWKLGHEKISTAILHLPLIQEEQLSILRKNVH